MRFVVPQFIDVEAKIIGSLGVRQFVIVFIGGGILFLQYRFLDIGAFIITGIPTVLVVALFGFVKINGQVFHFFLLNYFETVLRPSLRLWSKEVNTAEIKAQMKKPNKDTLPEATTARKNVRKSRLAELSLMLDTGGVYRNPEALK